ncbi:MAG: alpha/beta hydrolase [Actinomycetota bacterium]|nr:alpha/beta hydrolase [Actinomycetota bacterium]
MDVEVQFLSIDELEIEYYLYPASPERKAFPTLVFLHEGLGSSALWRSVPELVRAELGNPSMLVYSRAGYGKSTPVEGDRPVSYMHHEALEMLPRVLKALDIEKPILVGHSDGGSIALIHAGAGYSVSALVLIAPHVIVEDQSIEGIAAARETFLSTNLGEKMSRYHTDAESTFWGWNRVWLSPEFREWNIEEFLPSIEVPILVVQGDMDEYGTLAQLDLIARNVAGVVEKKIISGARHSPHLQFTDEVVEAVVKFLTQFIDA